VLTWTILVAFNNHIVMLARPTESEDVTFAVKLVPTAEALAGVEDTNSRVGAVPSTVNIRREVFTLPAVSVELTFT
jgi:hypothetical protein